MSISKVAAAAAGFVGLLATVGASAAAAEACKLGTEVPVSSVSAYRKPVETGGYAGTVSPVLRGADIRVAARPGLTAEWLERKLMAQVAAGECQFGVANPGIAVLSEGDAFVIRITGTDEGPGVTRLSTRALDERAANDILQRARELTR